VLPADLQNHIEVNALALSVKDQTDRLPSFLGSLNVALAGMPYLQYFLRAGLSPHDTMLLTGTLSLPP
jgi:hypothetical protein